VSDKLKAYSPYRCWNFSCFPIWFIPFSCPLFSIAAGSIYATRKVVDVKCFLLSRFFIGFKESFSFLSRSFQPWKKHKKRLVTSCVERIYITTPIENQLSIYYFWCGDHNEARGKEFIFDNRCEMLRGWSEINYTKLKRQSNQQR
jgi:hypothetical protein